MSGLRIPGFRPNESRNPDSPDTDGIPRTRGEAEFLQNYMERNEAELKRIHAIVHTATSAAPDIDEVLEETRRTPFTHKITSVRLHDVGKIKFPEYSGNSDPRAHVRAFQLSISRAHLSDEEKEAGYCRFFAENLSGSALEWFAGLEGNSIDSFEQLISAFLKQYSVFMEIRATEADLWNLKQEPFEPLRKYINRFREIKAKIANLNEGVAIAALKNGVWFSSKFREEMAVRAPTSLHDALHRASYFATHEEEVAALKEQYAANKNNAAKRTPIKEQPTKGQHSFAVNNTGPNRSSSFDPSKFCTFHNRKGHSTEECRAAQRNKSEQEDNNESSEREEPPSTPKSNGKTKVTSNKRGREADESPSSPPPAPKKRVDMISWGNTPRKVGADYQEMGNKPEPRTLSQIAITVTVEESSNPKATSVTTVSPQFNRVKAAKRIDMTDEEKRTLKMPHIRRLLEKPSKYEKRLRARDSSSSKKHKLSGGQEYSAPNKNWRFPHIEKKEAKRRIDFIYGGSKICNSINSIKAHQRRAESNIGIKEPLAGPNYEITFHENETNKLDKPHDDALVIRLDVGGCELSRVMIDTGSSADLLFYDAFLRMGFTKALLKEERTPLIGFAGETTYSLGSIELAVTAGEVRKIVEFIVIDRPAPFNAILGRPWLYSMKAVPSTYHQCLKFPTPKGIETIRGSQKSSRTCYLTSFKDFGSTSE